MSRLTLYTVLFGVALLIAAFATLYLARYERIPELAITDLRPRNINWITLHANQDRLQARMNATRSS